MNPFAAYRAVNTKIHGKKRLLLSTAEWQKVATYQSVGQVILFILKRGDYQKLVIPYKNEDIHRGDLEIILDHYVIKEVEAILHYFSGCYKEFFKTFLMEYEINDLQLLLRTISRGDENESLESRLVHSKKWGLECYPKLLACRTVPQFVEALKGTPYYEAVKTITQEDMQKREFHIEMKLYILFYQTFMMRAMKLNKKDAEIAQSLIGTRIDFINAQWIYRAIKYYDISSEEILIYSIPGGNKLTYSKLKDLSYTKQVDKLKEKIEKYLAYPLFKGQEDVYLDCMADRYLMQHAKRYCKEGEDIQLAMAYVYMLGIEKKDLITLTEGIRYGLQVGELNKYMVHTI